MPYTDDPLFATLRLFSAGDHKGKPVVTGNECTSFEGAAKTYLRDVTHNPPTSLEPDNKDIVKMIPCVTLAFLGGNTYHVLNLRREVARAAYKALEEIFEPED